ncbi:MAG: hypothetical protein DCC55_38955 [Chloroflexi bacterium]|nr:MAG: hypothetical protein DCC55_38955 [Chloroflexota bacterium]
MPHELYSSIDEMLAPATLSALEGRPIHYVRCLPFSTNDSASGSAFLKIETNGGGGTKYIVKRTSLAVDWIMRGTEDTLCRSVRLWQYGLLDRLPAAIDHAIVACAQDGEGWAMLMRDVGPALVPFARFSQDLNERFLTTMAQLHGAFWQASELDNPRLGLSTLRQLYTVLSPHTGHREAGGSNPIPPLILKGWDLFETLVAEDVAGIIHNLLDDPQPLCAALGRYPHTLVHGDWRHTNLGRLPGEPGQVALLDWQFATAAPPAVDLARYLAQNSAFLPIGKEESIELYRRQLAQELGAGYDERWWRPQLELGLLGGLLMFGWDIALDSIAEWGELPQELGGPGHWRNDLAWWSEQTRRAVKWL